MMVTVAERRALYLRHGPCKPLSRTHLASDIGRSY